MFLSNKYIKMFLKRLNMTAQCLCTAESKTLHADKRQKFTNGTNLPFNPIYLKLNKNMASFLLNTSNPTCT